MEELEESLKQLYERFKDLKEYINTEEATKMALIVPFLQTLGYDVFNPMELVPEYIADIGMKKGEKVDYVIMKDNNPIILIECKHWRENLKSHTSQLFRYFQMVNARIALLTNGIVYNFYTDSERQNIMDNNPFLSVDLSNLSDSDVQGLYEFKNNIFCENYITNKVQTMQYKEGIRRNFENEIENPSYDFVKIISKGVFFGHQKGYKWDEFRDLTKEVISEFIKRKIVQD